MKLNEYHIAQYLDLYFSADRKRITKLFTMSYSKPQKNKEILIHETELKKMVTSNNPLSKYARFILDKCLVIKNKKELERHVTRHIAYDDFNPHPLAIGAAIGGILGPIGLIAGAAYGTIYNDVIKNVNKQRKDKGHANIDYDKTQENLKHYFWSAHQLKSIRNKLGFSQSEFSIILDTETSTIKNYESPNSINKSIYILTSKIWDNIKETKKSDNPYTVKINKKNYIIRSKAEKKLIANPGFTKKSKSWKRLIADKHPWTVEKVSNLLNISTKDIIRYLNNYYGMQIENNNAFPIEKNQLEPIRDFFNNHKISNNKPIIKIARKKTITSKELNQKLLNWLIDLNNNKDINIILSEIKKIS